MTYRIEFRPAAQRALRKLDTTTQKRMQGALALLAENPRPPASRPLVGRPGWLIRVGTYRIIYTIDDDALVVAVIALGHRREIHRREIHRRAIESRTAQVAHYDITTAI